MFQRLSGGKGLREELIEIPGCRDEAWKCGQGRLAAAQTSRGGTLSGSHSELVLSLFPCHLYLHFTSFQIPPPSAPLSMPPRRPCQTGQLQIAWPLTHLLAASSPNSERAFKIINQNPPPTTTHSIPRLPEVPPWPRTEAPASPTSAST